VRKALTRHAWSGLHTLEQPVKKTQFEHLRDLASTVCRMSIQPDWVYFTDDDDLWSERRHSLYLQACRDAAAGTTAILCTRKARPSSAVEPTPLLSDAAGVRAALAAGQARLTNLASFDLSTESFNMDEYFDYALRFAALESFLACAPNAVLRHKLCDLAFASQLRRSKPARFTPSAHDEFVYWYSRPEGTPFAVNGSDGGVAGASTGVEIDATERQLARERMAAVRAAVEDSPCATMFDEDMLAFFLAACRQGIEQELVQLRMVRSTPRMSETDAAITRQLDLLLADHPLRGAAGAFARLHAAMLDILRGPVLQRLLRLLSFDPPRRQAC